MKYFLHNYNSVRYKLQSFIKPKRFLYLHEAPGSEAVEMSYTEQMKSEVEGIEDKIFARAGEKIPLYTAIAEAKSGIEAIAKTALAKIDDPEEQKLILNTKKECLNKIKENKLKYEQLKALAVKGVECKIKEDEYKVRFSSDSASVAPEVMLRLIRWAADLEEDAGKIEKMPALGHEEQKNNLIESLRGTADKFKKRIEQIQNAWTSENDRIVENMRAILFGKPLTVAQINEIKGTWITLRNFEPEIVRRMPSLQSFFSNLRAQNAEIQKFMKEHYKIFEAADLIDEIKEQAKYYRRVVNNNFSIAELKQMSAQLAEKLKQLERNTSVPSVLEQDKNALIADIKEIRKIYEENIKGKPEDIPTDEPKDKSPSSTAIKVSLNSKSQ